MYIRRSLIHISSRPGKCLVECHVNHVNHYTFHKQTALTVIQILIRHPQNPRRRRGAAARVRDRIEELWIMLCGAACAMSTNPNIGATIIDCAFKNECPTRQDIGQVQSKCEQNK